MRRTTVTYLIAFFLVAGSLPATSPTVEGSDRAKIQRVRYGCNPCREARSKAEQLDENGKLSSKAKAPMAAAFSDLPFHFTRNDGQTDKRVKFYERGQGHATFFTTEGVYLRLRRSGKDAAKPSVIKFLAVGGNKEPQIIGESPYPGKINHFIGADPKKWLTDIPTYGTVRYRQIYPGIDMKFYGKNRELEYDMIVRPGADPSTIRLAVEGINGLSINQQGELEMSLKGGHILQGKPYIYQEIEGKRVEIAGGFKLLNSGNRAKRFAYGFTVSDYDKSLPLVIDPTVGYSTFLGGSSSDSGWGIAADGTGNMYIAGETESNNFDTKTPFQGDQGGTDGFVAKFNPLLSGASSLVYSTYLGGSNTDAAYELEVNPATGNAYVTGFTEGGFPTVVGSHDTGHNGGRDVFLTVLNATGNGLLYSTYLGSNGTEEGYSVDLDASNPIQVYLTGYTNDSGFPTTQGSFDEGYNGGRDVFVSKINPDTVNSGDLVYSTFVGGGSDDEGNGIRVQDSNGHALVTGYTDSTGFPTTNAGTVPQVTAFDSSYNGSRDAFVFRLNPDPDDIGGTTDVNDMIYSTFLGGSGNDAGGGNSSSFASSPGGGGGIDVDSVGVACVAGETSSPNDGDGVPEVGEFPIGGTGVFDNTPNGGIDVFVARVNTTVNGSASLIYSTFIGGSGADAALDVSADADTGLCCVTGYTESSNFPTKDPIMQTFVGGAYNGGVKQDNRDAFILTLKLDPSDNTPGAPATPDPNDLLFSTFFGGDGNDFGAGVDARNMGQCCITGKTLDGSPDDFPATADSFQTMNDGNNDAFVTCADFLAVTAVTLESFTATAYDAGVLLNWDTSNDVNNLGYNIYRDVGGVSTRITPQLVAGSVFLAGPGTLLRAGMSYKWVDGGVTKDAREASYWLEEVDLSGKRTKHGPFRVDSMKPGAGLEISNSALISQVNAQSRFGRIARSAAVARTALLTQVNPSNLGSWFGIARRPAIKIPIRQEGWYSVTQPQLVAAGLHPEFTPRNLQLFVDGKQTPIVVKGEADGRFDPADSIEFYGLGLDTQTTDSRVYWLVAGEEPGRRIISTKSKTAPGLGGNFPYTVELKESLQYFPGLLNGEADNFFGAMVDTQPLDQTLTLSNVAKPTGAQANLEIALFGLTTEPHQVNVSLNGAALGTINFDGIQQHVATFSVENDALVEGANVVRLAAVPGGFDFSVVDHIRLTYRHSFRADNNSVRFSAATGRQVTIDGFSNSALRIMDVTDPNAIEEVSGMITGASKNFSITGTVRGSGQRMLLAFAADQVKPVDVVIPNQPSNLANLGNQADLIMITHSDFAQDLVALQQLRESQGLTVVTADVTDVFDEFGYGHKSSQAIRDFLAYAKSSWALPPRFVLLVGDASIDPRNFIGLGGTDLVPTKLVETSSIETASDEWLADFNDDGLAELAVGRLPARNQAEAATMIQKIINYDSLPGSGKVLLVADENVGYDFEAANGQLRDLVSKDMIVDEIRLGDTDPPSARNNLLAAINQGRSIVNYGGHGSVSSWAEGLFDSTDVGLLNNAGRWPVVVAMTCLNGYFVDESFPCLGQALMASEGGAVAVWSSSGLTAPYGQTVANQELFRQLFSGGFKTLGEAAFHAKASVSDREIRLTWVLLGDPTTRLR